MEFTRLKVNDDEAELRELVKVCVSDKSDEMTRQLNYSRFYNKCKNVFESILYKTTYNRPLAETIYNDSVLIFFEKVKDGAVIGNIKGFLYHIALNVYLNKVKPERKYITRFSFVLDKGNAFLNIAEGEDGNILASEFELTVNQAMAILKKEKPDQETVLRAFYLDELSYNKVSENLGYSLNEVKSHVQNGKQNLSKILADMKAINKS